ncbi:MAG: glutamate--tRNA ligase [Methanocellales archaeon]|nr:glutamate--tRNA ligase [Methanocellales archaeon]MDD3291174.1 glutamate--tRNA ligase [Methanocellales archaeon]MDD5235274.1 glutamate--tRNA ligase [Methanocellales archaeon]MDD5484570.1 glutamate--tRNA ligase [Methanocellales archaeon]
MKESIEKVIEKHALQNALKYDSAPLADAVMGKVLGECPWLRTKTSKISPLIQGLIEKVSAMTSDERLARLQQIAPELMVPQKKERMRGLPPLEAGEKVTMRIAPNPNGPPTLGNARGIIINHEYAQMYNGKFILRFDDTDPKTKRPMLEAYAWYKEDCEWLGANPDEIVIASDRIEEYYQYAEKLIKMGKAYICFCDRERFKIFKDSMKACPHREQEAEANLNHWKKMLAGEYDEGEAVLRIKTDILHKDPALRDWVALRVIKESHPRVGRKYVVWPMLDFESAMEDHLLRVTHIIRGKDLMDSEKRQKFIYDYFGWKYPKTSHWGRIKIHEFGKFSTSEIKRAIEKGEYRGWDDPRLPTVRALRRRGIQAEAIRNFMIDLGMSGTDIAVSMDTLYAENRKIVDTIANRYFFVWDPLHLDIENAMPTVAKAPLHPTERRGLREISVQGEVFVCKDDLQGIKKGDNLRLKDLYNIQITGLRPLRAEYIGNDLSITKKGAAIIHWCPPEGVKVKVIGPEKEYTGIGERGIGSELGNVVQFERFGFVRIDAINDEIVAYFAHK